MTQEETNSRLLTDEEQNDCTPTEAEIDALMAEPDDAVAAALTNKIAKRRIATVILCWRKIRSAQDKKTLAALAGKGGLENPYKHKLIPKASDMETMLPCLLDRGDICFGDCPACAWDKAQLSHAAALALKDAENAALRAKLEEANKRIEELTQTQNPTRRRDFLKLPVEERRKILAKQAQDLAAAGYDSEAKFDLGMME